MEFVINNDKWKIKEIDRQELTDLYNSENNDDSTYCFGVTQYNKHKILLNNELCYQQKIKTLKHELTHCYIWEYGLFNVPNFTEEMVCDLVASINDFINEVTEKYFKE